MLKSLKFVIVGDGSVGKTSLLTSYTTNRFNADYVPTIFDSQTIGVEVDNVPYTLTLWDTAGQEEYASLRRISYPDTDVFLLCFAIDHIASFNNIKNQWAPEVKHCCPDGKMMLVGTKNDLRNNGKGRVCVPHESAEKCCSEIGANGYAECSAVTQKGLRELFENCIRFVAKQRQQLRKKKSCLIL